MYCINCGNEIEESSFKCNVCGAKRVDVKTFSWLGFFFGLFYYAGKNIKKACLIYIAYLFITFTLDYFFINNIIYSSLSGLLYFIVLGIYIGIAVTKEPSFRKKEFNWLHANIFALVIFIISFSYQIYTFKGVHPQEYQTLMQFINLKN
ncbi:hypothetical protein [Francisella frigiditurris]|uniref:Zinc-ribbon domain protein n=1 Tax=Francisella frigiditurris TaxID=1542390 RepID=A0A1J0KRT9_9GAMM|nr:hypothetical protein [Francisella frigiditurris]APC96477.1 hypothetical protein KX01_1531 [Francisella frigiditurris]